MKTENKLIYDCKSVNGIREVYNLTEDEATVINHHLLNGEKFVEIIRLGVTLNTANIISLEKPIIE